ncbi:MAG: hypothetical protein R2867_21600 [Caldilineaceae bacterium]
MPTLVLPPRGGLFNSVINMILLVAVNAYVQTGIGDELMVTAGSRQHPTRIRE